MKKIYIFSLLAALTLSASAAVPFEKGKSAPPRRTAPAMTANRAPEKQTLVNEDFSKFSEGTEAEPAAEITYVNGYFIPDDMTAQPGWRGQGIRPAGGAVALFSWEDSYGDTRGGYTSTPPFMLGGTATLSLRAKKFGTEEAVLWVVLCDDYYGPGEDVEFELTDEWKTFTFEAKEGSFEEASYFQITSDVGTVLIDDVKLEFVRDRIAAPEALPAINVSATEFVAGWEPTDAPLYRLNVLCTEAPTETITGELVQNFDGINVAADGKTIDAANPGYPEGWTISLSGHGTQDVTTDEGNYNSAPLALVIDEVGDIIESETLPHPLDGLSFWVKPSAVEDDEYNMSMLRVDIYHSSTETWEAIANLPYYWMEESGDFYSFNPEALGDDVTKVRLSLTQKGLISFYIDDLKLHYRNRGTTTAIIDNLKLTETEYTVRDIDPANDYTYYVQAVDGEIVSAKSEIIWVDGISGLKVTTIEPTDVTSTSFTAHWEPLGHATSYKVEGIRLLNATADMSNVTVIEESFDKITEGSVESPGTDWVSPFDFGSKGWAATAWSATQPAWANGMAGTTGTSWMGTAGLVFSPVLDLSCNEGMGFDVEATVYTTVESFPDAEGNLYPEGVFVMVLNTPQDRQALAAALIETPATGYTSDKVTVNVNPDEVDLSNVIVAFMSKSGQMFFVDDVKITQNLKAGEKLSVPFMVDTTPETEYSFSDLDPMSDHGFTVTASTTRQFQTYTSEPSDLRIVPTHSSGIVRATADNSTVNAAGGKGCILVSAPEGTPAAAYTVAGTCVGRTSGQGRMEIEPGIYIVRVGDSTFKVAVR